MMRDLSIIFALIIGGGILLYGAYAVMLPEYVPGFIACFSEWPVKGCGD